MRDTTIFLIFAALGLGLTSCKDKLPPEIYTPTFGTDAAFFTGDTLLLDLTMVDNDELDRLSYSIFPQDADSLPGTITDPFEISGEAAATGNTVFIEKPILIPDSAASGNYVMRVTGFDISGNVTEETFSFTLQNSLDQVGPELIKENIPDTLQSTLITTLKASLLDDVALAEVKILVRQNATSNIVFFRKMPVSSGLIQVNEVVSFPVPGTYTISFQVRDWVNNITTADYIISVI